MSPVSPEAIFRRWFADVWNNGRADLIAAMMAPDAVVHGFDDTGAQVIGPEGFRPFYDNLRAACPDIAFTVEDVVAAGAMAAGRWVARVTHTGEGLGIRPTGRTVTVTGMSIVRIEDGLIAEAWNEWDRLAFATSLGMMAPVAP